MPEATSVRPFVVVLTGGPSSGKSSALALLRSRLCARGFQVLTVPENATHFLANSDGFQPEWAGTDAQVQMQRIFLEYQVAQEDAFKSFAQLHPTKPAVLLLDCCTLNSKVYIADEQWPAVLQLPGRRQWTEEELFARYDLVIHMVTVAQHGNYEWGPGSNNPGRYHTPEQASEQDQRCLRVFANHPQLRVVPHFPNFDDKIGKVVEFVNDALHIEGLAGKRRRRLCRVVSDGDLESLVRRSSSSGSVVTTTFLDEHQQHSVRRDVAVPSAHWLAQFLSWRTALTSDGDGTSSFAEVAASLEELPDEGTYERRSRKALNGQSFLTRSVLKFEDYRVAVQSCGTSARIAKKSVLRFLEGNHYYELFFFVGHRNLVLDYGVDAPDCPRWLEMIASASSIPTLPEEGHAAGVAIDALAAAQNVQHPLKCEDIAKRPLDATLEEERPLKQPRILRAHSTEEAAALRTKLGGS
jgi:hypothetical protein